MALALGVGALGLLGSVADLHRVASALSDADRRWLPVCVAGEVAAFTQA